MRPCNTHHKTARIHSLETFGTQEGPGIRFVIFMQGCLARCLYCQNPDTWNIKAGYTVTVKEVFQKLERYLPYIRSSQGGLTVSGGEPLLHIDFLIELFKLCRKNSIHTAVDTSAFFYPEEKGKLDRVIMLTDLFIVDIKAASRDLHKKLTSKELEQVLSFIGVLENKKKPYWLRYVLVPGLNDSKKDMASLKDIVSRLDYCEKFEFLPYHTLGRHKWELMGLHYALDNFPPASLKDTEKSERFIKVCK